MILAVIFGGANAYLGLRVGMTVSLYYTKSYKKKKPLLFLKLLNLDSSHFLINSFALCVV